MIPLWMMLALLACAVVAFIALNVRHWRGGAQDERQTIVLWGIEQLGEEIWAAIQQFEQRNPQYRVVFSSAVARNITGDAQRLMCAVAGGVPPDVVRFDRFAIGEWAARGALTDLTPYLEAQSPHDLDRIDLGEYYDWSIEEGSYKPPGSNQRPGIYGIPQSIGIRVLYSNANLLRQEGLVDEHGEPRPPRNWDELREHANLLTRYIDPTNKSAGLTRVGFAPNYGNSYLYIYAWQAGGEFMNPDRTRLTMDSPPVVRALRYMADIYDDLGGYKHVAAFQSSFQGGELDPFLKGTVAMKIDGDWSLQGIADWNPQMDFIVSPAPMPQDQLDAGREPITWAGGFSWVIPSTSRNKQGAWKLIQHLRSHDILALLEQGKRERKEAEGRIYLPTPDGNRVFYERMIERHVFSNPQMPPRLREAFAVLKEMMPGTLIRPVTPVGQLMWEQHRTATEAGVMHQYADVARATGEDEMAIALRVAQEPVQRALDQVLQPMPPETRVNWRPFFIAYALIVIAPFAALIVTYRRRRREYGYRAREVSAAMLFASPWIIGIIALTGGPIVFSIILSFTQYDVLNPAHHVGLANYKQVLSDPLFFKSLGNTAYMVLRIPLVMALSLAIAMLLNRSIRGIGVYRTSFYLPAIMPLVATSLLWVWMFNPSHGLLSNSLNWLFDTALFNWLEGVIGWMSGSDFRFTAPLWLQDTSWSKPSLILMNLWAAGGGMIIWLAGLQSIPQQLYEAANIDGAGPWQRFRHVTLPMLSPYVLFNAIVGLIGTMQIFGEAYIMTEGGPQNSTLFYAYHLFREAFQFFRMGYASALAWILFVVILMLTIVQLWLSKRWVHYEHA